MNANESTVGPATNKKMISLKINSSSESKLLNIKHQSSFFGLVRVKYDSKMTHLADFKV